VPRTQYDRFKAVRNERNWLREKITELVIEIELLSESVKTGAQGSNWITDDLDSMSKRFRPYTDLEGEE